MAQLDHDNKTYTVYIDISKKLEFIMENKEMERFQKLVKVSRKVEDIPEKEVLTGIYLNQARQVQGIICTDIVANKVRFAKS
jgi:hypothetical protein